MFRGPIILNFSASHVVYLSQVRVWSLKYDSAVSCAKNDYIVRSLKITIYYSKWFSRIQLSTTIVQHYCKSSKELLVLQSCQCSSGPRALWAPTWAKMITGTQLGTCCRPSMYNIYTWRQSKQKQLTSFLLSMPPVFQDLVQGSTEVTKAKADIHIGSKHTRQRPFPKKHELLQICP